MPQLVETNLIDIPVALHVRLVELNIEGLESVTRHALGLHYEVSC